MYVCVHLQSVSAKYIGISENVDVSCRPRGYRVGVGLTHVISTAYKYALYDSHVLLSDVRTPSTSPADLARG